MSVRTETGSDGRGRDRAGPGPGPGPSVSIGLRLHGGPRRLMPEGERVETLRRAAATIEALRGAEAVPAAGWELDPDLPRVGAPRIQWRCAERGELAWLRLHSSGEAAHAHLMRYDRSGPDSPGGSALRCIEQAAYEFAPGDGGGVEAALASALRWVMHRMVRRSAAAGRRVPGPTPEDCYEAAMDITMGVDPGAGAGEWP